MPELAEHLDLCAALAAGSLEASDRRKFAEHLAEGCEQCDSLLPAYERATVLLAAALPLSAPGASLRDRVIAGAAGAAPAPAVVALPAANARLRERDGRPSIQLQFRTPPGIWAAVSGVFVFAALACAAVAWHYYGQVKHLHEEIASGNEVITGLNQQLQDAKTWGELYTLSGTRTATLASTPRAEGVLRARAIYDARSQRAEFVFSDLKAPQGKVHQLWAIEGPRLRSLGVIKTDEDGRAVVRIENAGDPNRLTEFGVSLETAGGSTNPNGPSGPLVMVGKIEG
jgi:anti-sigma-K factor RskA